MAAAVLKFFEMGQLFWMEEEAMSQRTQQLLGHKKGLGKAILSKTLEDTPSPPSTMTGPGDLFWTSDVHNFKIIDLFCLKLPSFMVICYSRHRKLI